MLTNALQGQKTFHVRPVRGKPVVDHQSAGAQWLLVDAKDQVVGRLATLLTKLITGRHKVSFSPHVDLGDFVIVINADKVVLTRNKWEGKLYRTHSQFIGGLKTLKAREMLERRPTEILRRAVWGMSKKGPLARLQMTKLKIYVGDQHPHAAQKPIEVPVAVRRKTVLEKKKK